MVNIIQKNTHQLREIEAILGNIRALLIGTASGNKNNDCPTLVKEPECLVDNARYNTITLDNIVCQASEIHDILTGDVREAEPVCSNKY